MKYGVRMTDRRFPPPWSIEESAACFIVRDGDKQALAYVYFEGEPGRRSSAQLLTRDETFLIAGNIAKPRPPTNSGLISPKNLEPASSAVPATAADKQYHDDNDQKSCGVHIVLPLGKQHPMADFEFRTYADSN